MRFQNPLVAGDILVRAAIRSPDYVAGVSGWRVGRDGTAEFNNVTVRGSIEAGTTITGAVFQTAASPNPRVRITNEVIASYNAIIQLYTGIEPAGFQGYLAQAIVNTLGARQALVTLAPANLVGDGADIQRPRIDLYSRSIDGVSRSRDVYITNVDILHLGDATSTPYLLDKAVSLGAPDSAGVGFRLVRAAN